MLSRELENGLNRQITMEFYSAYMYTQMAAYFESKDLRGFAHWMKVQAREEVAHGLILFNYVGMKDGTVELGAFEKPPHEFKSPVDAMEVALDHEQQVTRSISELYAIAQEEGDLSTKNRLEWFIKEQVEEEATPTAIIARLKLAGNDGSGLFMMDQELEKRQYKMPEPLAGSESDV